MLDMLRDYWKPPFRSNIQSIELGVWYQISYISVDSS